VLKLSHDVGKTAAAIQPVTGIGLEDTQIINAQTNKQTAT